MHAAYTILCVDHRKRIPRLHSNQNVGRESAVNPTNVVIVTFVAVCRGVSPHHGLSLSMFVLARMHMHVSTVKAHPYNCTTTTTSRRALLTEPCKISCSVCARPTGAMITTCAQNCNTLRHRSMQAGMLVHLFARLATTQPSRPASCDEAHLAARRGGPLDCAGLADVLVVAPTKRVLHGLQGEGHYTMNTG